MLLLFMSYLRSLNIMSTALIRARYLMWVSGQPTGFVPFTLLLGVCVYSTLGPGYGA